MVPIVSLLIVLILSIFVIRIATVALTLNGLSKEMARAKAQGKGRHRISRAMQDKIAQFHQDGVSINQIQNRLGIAYGTVWNYVQKLKEPNASST